MRLFTSDFLRSFAIGFALAGIGVWSQMGDRPEGLFPTAIAAATE